MGVIWSFCDYATKLNYDELGGQIPDEPQLEYPWYRRSQPVILDKLFRQNEARVLVQASRWQYSQACVWNQRQQARLRRQGFDNDTRDHLNLVVVQLHGLRFLIEQVSKERVHVESTRLYFEILPSNHARYLRLRSVNKAGRRTNRLNLVKSAQDRRRSNLARNARSE